MNQRIIKVESVQLLNLVEDHGNPRTHDRRNLDAIKASLMEFGQVEPLVVQRSTMMVVGGNGRMSAMRELGWESAQVVVLDITDVEARALSVTLNRTGELADWDSERLMEAVAKLDGEIDLTSLGWTSEELEVHIDSLSDPSSGDDDLGGNANPGRTVRFQFGDLSANISKDVYDRFIGYVEARRSTFPMLDDLMRHMMEAVHGK